MTVTEFFLKQNTKEIKEKFKEIKLDKYYNFPENLKAVCSMLNLEDDKKCNYFHVIKRRSTAEVYMGFNLPNPAAKHSPIYFKATYYITSAKGACSVSLGLESHIEIFKQVSTIFDDRKEYNNIEFRVWKESLPEIFDEKESDWDGNKKYYCLKNNLTPWDYYQGIYNYAEGVKPLLDMFVKATENGEFEKTWNKLKPHNKWERGHEIFHSMFFPVIMNDYYKAVKAGATPNLEDFTMLFAASDELGKNKIPGVDKLQEAFDKIAAFNSPNETIIEGFNYALNYAKQKYIVDNSLQKWANTYVEANKELLNEVNKLKEKISNKHNISTEWLRCTCLFRNEKEVKWDSDYIPENAYVVTR